MDVSFQAFISWTFFGKHWRTFEHLGFPDVDRIAKYSKMAMRFTFFIPIVSTLCAITRSMAKNEWVETKFSKSKQWPICVNKVCSTKRCINNIIPLSRREPLFLTKLAVCVWRRQTLLKQTAGSAEASVAKNYHKWMAVATGLRLIQLKIAKKLSFSKSQRIRPRCWSLKHRTVAAHTYIQAFPLQNSGDSPRIFFEKATIEAIFLPFN